MTLSFKASLAALVTLFFPGLGQLFYGKILWALFWVTCGVMTGGLANICAAIHIFFLAAK